MKKLILLLAATVILVGCKSETKESSSSPGDNAAGKTTPTPDKPTTRRTKLEEAKLGALLDAWLAAQNKGDFDAYSKLYAKKFNGVKRAGAKTSRFARAGWLADRQRMFKKKMTVEANERSFNASYTSGLVSFSQRWASGKYEDVGPKRLLVVLEDGELKIAQEEMLASEVLRSKADKNGDFYFLYNGGIVLHDAEAPAKHGKPMETEGAGGEEITTTASVKESDLDPAVLAWKGKKVRVDGECETTITGFSLISRLTPHFGTEQEWSCTDGSGEPMEDCEPASDDDKASQAFDEGNPQVLAELGDCDGTYARLASQPKVIVGEAVSDAVLEAKAQAAFGKLAAVTDQADESADGKAWWDKITSVKIFKHPRSGQVLVSAYADNGGTCGEFSASGWQLWEAKGGNLLPVAYGSAPVEIVDAIDTDGDGILEFLVKGDEYGTELALIDGRSLESRISVGYSYHDCPC